MDVNFLKCKDEINIVKERLEKLVCAAELKTMEDKEVCRTVERLIEQLDDAKDTLKYFSKATKIGYLEEESNGKFSFDGTQLSCGNSLELWNEESNDWVVGRVEHKQDNYYFFDDELDHPILYHGMKCRRRMND